MLNTSMRSSVGKMDQEDLNNGFEYAGIKFLGIDTVGQSLSS